jgi:hypothetical protein
MVEALCYKLEDTSSSPDEIIEFGNSIENSIQNGIYSCNRNNYQKQKNNASGG